MASNWILLHSVPPSGKEFVLDDQSVWTDPIKEFSLSCTIREPLKAVFFVLTQDDGVLIRGRITGKAVLPCNRCMEDAVVAADQEVDVYEPYPSTNEEADAFSLDANEELLRFSPSGQGMEINLAALAWQEFSLALPMKPLCGAECKGLCPVCGVNRNTASCSCETDALDPRMAPLRGLKVGR